MTEYQRGLEAAAQECDRIVARITGNSQMAHTQRAIASGAAAAIRVLTPTKPEFNVTIHGKEVWVSKDGAEYARYGCNSLEDAIQTRDRVEKSLKAEGSVEVPQPAISGPLGNHARGPLTDICECGHNRVAHFEDQPGCPFCPCEEFTLPEPATPPEPQPELSDMCECGVIYGEHSADTLATPLLHCPEKRSGVFWKWKDRTFRRAGVPVEPTPEVLTCSKCRITDSSVKKIGKGSYCSKCWAKIGPKYPPRAKDSFEFYDKIYHPTTGKPPATWEFADAYATYRIELAGVEQPTPKEAKWISVEVQMPEYDTDVILGSAAWPRVYLGYWRHSEEWIGRYRAEDREGPLPDTNPTHWQPLPAPPSGLSQKESK